MSATIEAVLSGSAGPVPGAKVMLRRKSFPQRFFLSRKDDGETMTVSFAVSNYDHVRFHTPTLSERAAFEAEATLQGRTLTYSLYIQPQRYGSGAYNPTLAEDEVLHNPDGDTATATRVRDNAGTFSRIPDFRAASVRDKVVTYLMDTYFTPNPTVKPWQDSPSWSLNTPPGWGSGGWAVAPTAGQKTAWPAAHRDWLLALKTAAGSIFGHNDLTRKYLEDNNPDYTSAAIATARTYVNNHFSEGIPHNRVDYLNEMIAEATLDGDLENIQEEIVAGRHFSLFNAGSRDKFLDGTTGTTQDLQRWLFFCFGFYMLRATASGLDYLGLRSLGNQQYPLQTYVPFLRALNTGGPSGTAAKNGAGNWERTFANGVLKVNNSKTATREGVGPQRAIFYWTSGGTEDGIF